MKALVTEYYYPFEVGCCLDVEEYGSNYNWLVLSYDYLKTTHKNKGVVGYVMEKAKCKPYFFKEYYEKL